MSLIKYKSKIKKVLNLIKCTNMGPWDTQPYRLPPPRHTHKHTTFSLIDTIYFFDNIFNLFEASIIPIT